jgi:hypothetical protein
MHCQHLRLSAEIQPIKHYVLQESILRKMAQAWDNNMADASVDKF